MEGAKFCRELGENRTRQTEGDFEQEKDNTASSQVYKKIRGQHIMKKALIICAAGMSSSVIARKTTAHLKEQGNDIEVNATSQSQGATAIAKDEYDLYLVSPQTKMYFNILETAAKKQNKPIVNIPPQAYVPIPMGIEKLSKVITDHI